MRRIGGYVAIVNLCLALAAFAKSPVTVPRCDAPPAIDGVLDDGCWSTAASIGEFVQTRPADNAPPSRATTVLVAYDTQALYVAIRATDDPSRVRATVAHRDDVLADDYVQLHLDTFDDRRRAYVLIFNPLGVQQDGIYAEGGAAVDYSVDVLMTSKGRVTADGYAIEVAIPFSSLRYRAGNGARWGMHVQRRIQHLDEDDSWMPLVRGSAALLAQAGHLTGFDELDARRTFEVIPSMTVAESGRRVRSSVADRFDTEPVDTDPGVSMKLALTPDIALDATVNPDFAQIESDQIVVTANQRFPIFFEEKRPFFLEGIDVFQTPLNAVHSRTIIDPDYALKTSGRSGRTGFGVLLASDNAPGIFSAEERENPAIDRFVGRNAFAGVARVRRDVGTKESYLGMLATSYDFVDKQNRTLGVDGRLALDARTVVSFQLLGTFSKHSGKGLGFFAEWRRTGRHNNVTISGEGRTRDYRADLGFTTQTDTNRWSIVYRYDSEPRPDAPLLLSWVFTNTAFSQWNWDGRVKYAYVYPRVRFNFRKQTFAMIYAYSDYLHLEEDEFGAGAFFGDPERSTIYKGVVLQIGTNPTKKFSAELSIDHVWDFFDYDFGAGPRYPRVSPAALADPSAPLDPGTGQSQNITGRLELQPTNSLRLTLDTNFYRLVRDDTGRTAFDERLYSVQATQFLTAAAFARARVDYDSIHANYRGQILLGWTPSPGTSIYAGYTDDLTRDGFSPFTGLREPGTHRNRRTLFVKASYLVRRPF
ncbi:MAG TPA: DUF5916 domain-containing protein [Thermoanaerobaculia bacterium]|nr:DUF5916 domain-containing protein [Thermoanaerobaculia bacterium]